MENKPFKTLSRRADFLDLKATGQSIHVSPWLLVNLKRTNRGHMRCGFTLTRHIGSAVIRNRFKRWGKEYLRRWSRKHPTSLDLNLIFKRRDRDFYRMVNHREFDEVMDKLVAKLMRFR